MELCEEGEYVDLENGVFGAKNGQNDMKIEPYQKKLFYLLNKVDINGIFELKLKENRLIETLILFEKYFKYHMRIKINFKEVLI